MARAVVGKNVGEKIVEHLRVKQRERRVDHVQVETAIDDCGEVVEIRLEGLAGDPTVTAFASMDEDV